MAGLIAAIMIILYLGYKSGAAAEPSKSLFSKPFVFEYNKYNNSYYYHNDNYMYVIKPLHVHNENFLDACTLEIIDINKFRRLFYGTLPNKAAAEQFSEHFNPAELKDYLVNHELHTKHFNTHHVIKRQDAIDGLTHSEYAALNQLIDKIGYYRENLDKENWPSYAICNADEPYYAQVVEVIRTGEYVKNKLNKLNGVEPCEL